MSNNLCNNLQVGYTFGYTRLADVRKAPFYEGLRCREIRSSPIFRSKKGNLENDGGSFYITFKLVLSVAFSFPSPPKKLYHLHYKN